jgi:hypothetical protein
MALTPPTKLTHDDLQLLRRAALKFLTDRQALSFTAADLHSRIADSRSFDFEIARADIDSMIAFLVSSGWAVARPSTSGAAIFYQATSAGVLAIEQDKL